MNTFTPGTVLIFEPKNLSESYWNGLSEEEKIRYYGWVGYGSSKIKFFIFIAQIYTNIDTGHCLLCDMDGKLYPMCHPQEFRIATEDEF